MLVQIIEKRSHKTRVFAVTDASKIGKAAHLPQKLGRSTISGARHHLCVRSQGFQRDQVVGVTRTHQMFVQTWRFKRADQRLWRAKLQVGVAPHQFLLWRKPVVHDRLGHLIGQKRRLARDAERPVVHMPPSTPRNLRQFMRKKRAHTPPIEFLQRRKRHMVDIKVQPHANRIRGNQVINITVLVHLNLRVAGPRAKRTHHNGHATLLTAHQLGDGVKVINGKPNNRRTPRHPADLF